MVKIETSEDAVKFLVASIEEDIVLLREVLEAPKTSLTNQWIARHAQQIESNARSIQQHIS